ncbi:Ammonium transporter [Planctomycetales bacterium 10988]|nr:Ammonium transporter [Planctomycetales bacterium 10988]
MDDPTPLTSAELQHLIELGWLLTSAALVLFMQAGFCCLEAGAVRHKNSINVAIKNAVDLCASFCAYFVIGYSLMFGTDLWGLIGSPSLFLSNLSEGEVASFLFQVTFCSTAATIVSGGVAERCRFLPYVIVSMVIGLFIYPVFGHWVWGGGWLSQLGYHDFAGSSVVHMVGGGVALAGIQVLGPRTARYSEDGTLTKIPASSMPMVALGVIILTFGWIGFNGGSAPLSDQTPTIITNTLLAACFGGMFALLGTWAYAGLASVELILNGILGGLVAITACADCVTLPSAAMIGMAGGLSVIIGTALLDYLKLDDAVGAVPVHLVAGIVGILLTGVFGKLELTEDFTRWMLIGVQALGALVCFLWSYVLGLGVWWVTGKVISLRVGKLEEKVGLNFSEHLVEDDFQSLVEVLSQAQQQGNLDSLKGLQDHRDPQVAKLTQSLLAFADTMQSIDRVEATPNMAWESLEGIYKKFNQQQEAGEQEQRQIMKQFQQLTGGLEQLITVLNSYRQNPQPISTLAELCNSMRDSSIQIAESLPHTIQTWKQLGRTTEQLHQLKNHLRGDMA